MSQAADLAVTIGGILMASGFVMILLGMALGGLWWDR